LAEGLHSLQPPGTVTTVFLLPLLPRNVALMATFLAAFLPLNAVRAFDQRPAIGVRFYVEANPQDGGAFISKIKLHNPPREAAISTLPIISEKQIESIYLFQTADTTWGAAFELDVQGRIRLQTSSMESRGLSMVAMVATKRGTHHVTDMLIDRPITDGIITIMRGLSDGEAIALRKKFKPMGQAAEEARKAAAKQAAKNAARRSRTRGASANEEWVPE
jgi:hypothetical protein